VGRRGRHHGPGDGREGRRGAAPPPAPVPVRAPPHRPGLAALGGRHEARPQPARQARAGDPGRPARRPARPRPRGGVRPFHGRCHGGPVLPRGLPLPSGPQSRRHPAVRDDDRPAVRAAVPHGVLGEARAGGGERRHLPARRLALHPGGRAGYPAPRFQRHGAVGRPAARARRAGQAGPGAGERDHPRHRPRVFRPGAPRATIAAARRPGGLPGSCGSHVRGRLSPTL
jgi:hypothetical protein